MSFAAYQTLNIGVSAAFSLSSLLGGNDFISNQFQIFVGQKAYSLIDNALPIAKQHYKEIIKIDKIAITIPIRFLIVKTSL